MDLNLVPVQHISCMPEGYSKPQLIQFSDGMSYVVKFKNNPTGTRVLVNEYVAASLGQLLSLPVIPFQVVSVSNDFIKAIPEMVKSKFKSGSQFASQYIEGSTYLTPDFFKIGSFRIHNQDILAGVILFDLWLSNTDRKEKNTLLKPLGANEHYFYMMDHGRCFADSNWTIKTLKNTKMNLNLKVHQWCYSLLKDRNALNDYLVRILSLSDETIKQVVFSIPQDWDVSVAEREALLSHLINTRNKLPDLLVKFKKLCGSS
ncbi:HipA family kinase [Paenibacillus qinlingensis]|uniref:HipA-like kinase domain-containing protein n=1 Tax=Paenibacillus qinlingensis TaxID=1837343 RepID=A0ABU1NTA6_9BACL|nr:HipA family kinase [Paenibacillus qinlingensis]MDR6550685.1 hypothetical protein [Paenibacillus qinlingensis]